MNHELLPFRVMDTHQAVRFIPTLRATAERLGDPEPPYEYHRLGDTLWQTRGDDECIECGDYHEYCRELRKEDVVAPWWAGRRRAG
jgi:hypothetical protein